MLRNTGVPLALLTLCLTLAWAGARAKAVARAGTEARAGAGTREGTVGQKRTLQWQEIRSSGVRADLRRRYLQQPQEAAQVGMVQKFETELQADVTAAGTSSQQGVISAGSSRGETGKQEGQQEGGRESRRGGKSQGEAGGSAGGEEDVGSMSVEALRETVERQRKAIAGLTGQLQEARKSGRGSRRAKPLSLFLLQEDDPSLWRQRELRKHGPFGLLTYSAYRLTPTLITTVGFGANNLRNFRQPKGCIWHSDNGSKINGSLQLQLVPQNFFRPYEYVLVECHLSSDGGATLNSAGMYTSTTGGYLEVNLDQEIFYPYKETQGYEIHSLDSSGPFPHNFAFCGPPMFGAIEPLALSQWMNYHRFHMGLDYFIFYDAGSIDADVRKELDPFVSKGLLTITPFEDILQFDLPAQGQHIAMHDCLYRTRDLARWVAFHDFDEYLEAVPPLTVHDLLAKNADKAWLTHGCYAHDIDRCGGVDVWDPSLGQYAVEVLQFRVPHPFCEDKGQSPEYCIMGPGHRKLIYNPRKVQQTGAHFAVRSRGGGKDMSVHELRHAHFRGLQVEGRACKGQSGLGGRQRKKARAKLEGLYEWQNPSYNATGTMATEKVTAIGNIAKQARQCALLDFRENCS